MRRVATLGILVCALVALPALAAHHETVVQVVAVKVNPGMLGAYQAEIQKLQGVMERLGGTGTVRMWVNAQGGTETGTILVGLEYPSAAAWASEGAQMQADPEWQSILGGLDRLRTVVSSSVWDDVSPGASSGEGSVLVVTNVTVQPGKLAQYQAEVGKLIAIGKRLGSTARIRIWQASLAGRRTGEVAVTAEYKDLATYVSEQAQVADDEEWQSILSGLDEIRSFDGRSLYQDVTP